MGGERERESKFRRIRLEFTDLCFAFLTVSYKKGLRKSAKNNNYLANSSFHAAAEENRIQGPPVAAAPESSDEKGPLYALTAVQ